MFIWCNLSAAQGVGEGWGKCILAGASTDYYGTLIRHCVEIDDIFIIKLNNISIQFVFNI